MAKEPKPAAATPEVSGAKPAAAGKRKKEFKKKRERRVVPHGLVHIAASFNNTQITITDTEGRVMCSSSAYPRRHADSAQRLPPAQAPPRLTARNSRCHPEAMR